MIILGRGKSHSELDWMFGRVTSDEWVDFFLTKIIIDIIKTGFPSTLNQSLMSQSYEEGIEPGKISTYDKIVNRIVNRISAIK